jgi:phosphate transport system substrate-binding protein
MNKKNLIFIIWILLIMTGCNNQYEEINQKIIIAGSGSGIEMIKTLIPSFNAKYPDINIEFLTSTSSGEAVTGVAGEMLDIGTMARPMKDSEKKQYPQVKEYIFLKDAMILGVNENVNIDSVTDEELIKIHAGEIKNWEELGGNDGKIIVLDREESESSKLLLREKIIGDINITPEAILLYSSTSTDENIENTENSIGQTSLGIVKSYNLKIKPLAINGVMPSVRTIMSGEYELIRNYGIVINENRISEPTQKFINYILSDEARNILEEKEILSENIE